MESLVPQKIHIAFVITSLVEGGMSRVVVTLANEFVKRGYSVDILVTITAAGPYTRELSRQIKVIPMDFFEGGLYHYELRQSSRMLPAFSLLLKCVYLYLLNWKDMVSAISWYMQKRKPDVFICNDYVEPVVMANLKSTHRAKIIMVEHVAYSATFSANMSFFNDYFLTKIKSVFYKSIDKVVAVSKGVRDDLISKNIVSKANSCCIYNPIDLETIKLKSLESSGHPWLINKTVPVFLSLGRLERQKNYDLLLKAFTLLRSKLDCRLIILGNGSERHFLEGLARQLGIENFVSMPGFKNNPYAYLKMADAFVMSSSYEGFQMVLVEALICGTTCVSTDCPHGPSEILAKGKYGYLVPVNDVETLADTMHKAIFNPISPLTLQSRAEFFSADICMDKYDKLIQSIMRDV